MKSTTYGYIRISSKDQNEARQVTAMLEFGIPKTRMYTDKQSGKDFNRPSYKRMLSRLHPGDIVVIKYVKIDTQVSISLFAHSVVLSRNNVVFNN